ACACDAGAGLTVDDEHAPARSMTPNMSARGLDVRTYPPPNTRLAVARGDTKAAGASRQCFDKRMVCVLNRNRGLRVRKAILECQPGTSFGDRASRRAFSARGMRRVPCYAVTGAKFNGRDRGLNHQA